MGELEPSLNQLKRLAGPDDARRSGHRIQHACDLLDGSQGLRRVGKAIPRIIEEVGSAQLEADHRQFLDGALLLLVQVNRCKMQKCQSRARH